MSRPGSAFEESETSIYQLEETQFALAQPLFAELSRHHLSPTATLAGNLPGKVYVDSLERPQVGFVISTEGYYLAGDPTASESYAGLREIIPPYAYLIADVAGWGERLSAIWAEPAARPHQRLTLRWRAAGRPIPQIAPPEGYQLLPIDQALLDRGELKNHAAIEGWVGGWHSPADFLARGFGFCLVQGDTIASWSLTDCVVGGRCEIGITTDRGHRRRGLAAAAVAAMLGHAVARGIEEIGWHCFSSNAGSIAVAERCGFVREQPYLAYSTVLPTENPGDMRPAEYADWAAHYEQKLSDPVRRAFRAAEAWAMAEQPARALSYLSYLSDISWQGQPAWLAENWKFASLHGEPIYEALLAALRQRASDTQPSDE